MEKKPKIKHLTIKKKTLNKFQNKKRPKKIRKYLQINKKNYSIYLLLKKKNWKFQNKKRLNLINFSN